MTTVNLAARRWDKGDGRPGSHTLRDMLEAAIAKLDSGEIKAQHMILCYATEADGVGDDGYMQAGTFGTYAQIGLARRIESLITHEDDI